MFGSSFEALKCFMDFSKKKLNYARDSSRKISQDFDVGEQISGHTPWSM